MASKLKPVDDSPICDEAYLRRIDPVWMPGPVPPRFWEDRAHRRDYLLWLAGRLRFRHMQDFYRLTSETIVRNRGKTPVHNYWRYAPICAVKERLPRLRLEGVAVSPGLNGVLAARNNRRRYMSWLGERLGFRRSEDWYAVTGRDFRRHGGRGFLNFYSDSMFKAMLDLMPQIGRFEWKFTSVPIAGTTETWRSVNAAMHSAIAVFHQAARWLSYWPNGAGSETICAFRR